MRRRPSLRVLSTLAVLLLAASGSRPAAADDRTTVPEVIDLSAEDAANLLSSVGFQVLREEVEGDPSGIVARQSPGGFTRAKTGAAVKLFVRRGKSTPTPAGVPEVPPIPPPSPPSGTSPAAVSVPDVLGRTEADAMQALAGWRVRVLSALGAERNDGRVIDQSPAAGTPLAAGSEVAITVARRRADSTSSVVPSVVGLDADVAARQVTGLGLVPLVTQAPAEPANAGKVIAQDPAPGTVVAKGSNVALSVGAPAGGALMETEVPDLVRLFEADARARIAQAGLLVATQDVLAGPAPPGTVLAQDPPPGARLLRGRPVTITVGRVLLLPIRVPDTLGLDPAAAARTLRDAGFGVEETTSVSLPGSAGRVIAQDPPGGENAMRGSFVRITVGRPTSAVPVNVTVPNVVGRPETQATADLLAVGLSPRVNPVRGNPPSWGRVAAQTPAAGASVPRGTEVVLDVPRSEAGPAPIVLPNFVGTDVATAQADLAARGLTAVVTAALGAPDGRVLSQTPPAGTTVPAGSSVTLVVARTPPLEQVTLIEPADRTSVPRAYGATFRWADVAGADDYQFEILVMKDGAWVTADNDITRATSKRPSRIKKGVYQWHVRARRDNGRILGPWSDWRTITWY